MHFYQPPYAVTGVTAAAVVTGLFFAHTLLTVRARRTLRSCRHARLHTQAHGALICNKEIFF